RFPVVDTRLTHTPRGLTFSEPATAVQPAVSSAGPPRLHGSLTPGVRKMACRWRRKRVPKWRRSGPLSGEPFGVSLSLFPEALSGTARSRQGCAVVGRGEANP